MKKTRLIGLLVLLILGLVLVACGGEVQDAVEEIAPTIAAKATEVAPTLEAAATAVAEKVEKVAEEPAGLPDLGGREVTVAIENQYLPFNYINVNTGEAEGWDYEAWEEICILLNCKPVFVEAGWEGMIQAVADGQYDAAADGITITSDRAEIVDFSDGYITLEQRLLARKDEDRISSIADVQNNSDIGIGTQTGTTNYETALEYFDEDRIQAYETFPFAVQALLSGDVDVVVMDETAGQGYVGVNADDLKLVAEALTNGEELGFIFPLGSDLVESVNNALAEMKSNGTLERLAEKFFSDAFVITYDDIEAIEYDE